MSDLRSKVIRLAHEHPEFREHLLPLVKLSFEEINSRDAGDVIQALEEALVSLAKVRSTYEDLTKGYLKAQEAMSDASQYLKWYGNEYEAVGAERELSKESRQVYLDETRNKAAIISYEEAIRNTIRKLKSKP